MKGFNERSQIQETPSDSEFVQSVSSEEPLHTSPVFLPGTQPHDLALQIADPSVCAGCHGGYEDYSPYDTWKGSMMSFAALDPQFLALNAISNRDLEGVVEVGDYCLRCHTPAPWLEGRSEPVDGSNLTERDLEIGVSCDFCHRLIDPLTEEGKVQSRPDTMVHANGQYVVSPVYERRGPYDDPMAPHPAAYSEFHTKSEICATCHDIYNPVYELGTPVETTYSEWKFSAFSEEGIECQDCHMPKVTGYAAYSGDARLRDNIFKHEFVGASVWMVDVIMEYYDLDPEREEALKRTRALGIEMLQRAADLDVKAEGGILIVNITNKGGHKLPTGYPEGKRMWLNVRFMDSEGVVIKESGRYDPVDAMLIKDKELKVYEAKPGLKDIDGYPDGPSFHFALNNWIYKDNRIPARGFNNADYERRMAYIRGAEYEDGQYWDITRYQIPPGTDSVEVILWHQGGTRDFIEFLRDENKDNPWDFFNAGERLYEVWLRTGKSPPVEMNRARIEL